MVEKSFAVVGDPVNHSLSPLIHKCAYQYLGLDWDYSAIQVPPGHLADFVASTDLAGISVTMPLKFEAFALSTASNREAEALGVVNTLVQTESGWLGYNTDVFGIVQAVTQANRGRLGNIAILGSGATARSALYAASLLDSSAKVTILARSSSHSTYFLGLMRELSLSGDYLDFYEDLSAFDLVINTTPVVEGFKYKTGSLVLNASYKRITEASIDVTTISGTEMLIWQAIAQLRIFVNSSVEVAFEDEPELANLMRMAITKRLMGE